MAPVACFEPVHGLPHGVVVGGVEGQGVDGGARVPQPGGGGVELGGIAPVQHDRGPSLRQALRQRIADALRRPGDQGAFAGKIEECVRHRISF